MSDADDIAAIEAAGNKPQSMSADGVSVTNRSIDDEIKRIKFKRDLEAQSSSNANLGIRINQIVPSGGAQ